MTDDALSGYACVTGVETSTSPVYGEVTTVTLDTTSGWVYRELLDAIADEGYSLVGFGVGEECHDKATFVYRGDE